MFVQREFEHFIIIFITFRSYDENGKKVYTLFKVPKSKSHTDNCRPDPLNHIVHEFSRRCYQKVEDDPIESIGDIYSETRKELSQNLSEEDKISFYGLIPALRDIESGLYQYRENFRPKQPAEYVSI